MIVCVRPGGGAGHAVAADCGDVAAGVAETDDGAWQLASTPSNRTEA
jgi:hypothetical protein